MTIREGTREEWQNENHGAHYSGPQRRTMSYLRMDMGPEGFLWLIVEQVRRDACVKALNIAWARGRTALWREVQEHQDEPYAVGDGGIDAQV